VFPGNKPHREVEVEVVQEPPPLVIALVLAHVHLMAPPIPTLTPTTIGVLMLVVRKVE